MLECIIQTMQEGSWLPYNHHSNPERTNIQLFLSTMIFFSNKHLMSYFSEIDFMIKSYSKKLRRFNKLPLVNQQCVGYHFKCDLCDADNLCRLLVPTPTPTNWGTQRIGSLKPSQRATWSGTWQHCAEF